MEHQERDEDKYKQKLTPAGFCISTGLMGLLLNAFWWKAEFAEETQFLSCMWYWGLECSAAAAAGLFGGKTINYSPIAFWLSAICVGIGVILLIISYAKEPSAGAK